MAISVGVVIDLLIFLRFGCGIVFVVVCGGVFVVVDALVLGIVDLLVVGDLMFAVGGL